MPDLLVTGGPLLVDHQEFFDRGAVLIRDGLVRAAGDAAWLGTAPPGVEVLDAAGGLIMPGLVNAHCHAAMVLFRGLADDLELHTWLSEHIFPAEATWVDQAMVEACTSLAAAEMLLAGITTVCDAYFCMDGAVAALAAAGLRAVAAQGLIDFPAPGAPDPAQALEVCRRFIERWQGAGELITPAIFAHSTDTCSADTLRSAADLAGRRGCPLLIHLSESRGSVDQCRRDHGLTPVAWLESLGVLETLTAGVHGVWLEPADIELLARRQVGLVLCPESNMKLASGAADHRALAAAGLTLGLGTDGAASNNNLDILGEAASLARLAKVTAGDPAALPVELVLETALAGGAAAVGLGGKVGALKPGMAGDLIVVDLAAPHLTPRYSLASHLVYAARAADVRHVVVAGRRVVADRRLLTMDVDQTMARVRELAARVAGG